MTKIGMYEAKTHFQDIVRRVSEGEQITVTRHGAPVMLCSPAKKSSKEDVRKAIDRIKELAKGQRLDGISIRELIEEGRD